VRALYHAASVYVTASRSENHPLTLLEAAAAGLPSLVRADAGLAPLVADGVATAIAGDDDELVARALVLTEDAPGRDRLGAAARRAAARFSAGAHLDLTERLYRDLVGTPCGGHGQWTTVRSRT
jgi:1,2-diacylglycerol 3-alpha-glucosyltransferase